MEIAILFWIYKDLDVCIDRARLLRELNPNSRIYALYGGSLNDASRFEKNLDAYLDDFYAFPDMRTPHWKWINGDRLIADWFERRGQGLPWDTIFIAQWDMLMLAPVSRLLPMLKPDQLMLPGLRPISEVETWWWWVWKGSKERKEYEKFRAHLAGKFPAAPLCCNFITAALPRRFLKCYSAIAKPELGFLEYKIPVYAQIWGFSFCTDHSFNPSWTNGRLWNFFERLFLTFHAEKPAIYRVTILFSMLLPWGKRIFHPYTKRFPRWLVTANKF